MTLAFRPSSAPLASEEAGTGLLVEPTAGESSRKQSYRVVVASFTWRGARGGRQETVPDIGRIRNRKRQGARHAKKEEEPKNVRIRPWYRIAFVLSVEGAPVVRASNGPYCMRPRQVSLLGGGVALSLVLYSGRGPNKPTAAYT